MVMEFFRGSSETGLEHIERQIVTMLADTRHSFDAAMSALLGGADPQVIGEDVRTTDRRVNAAEKEIRRELMVHAAVHGSGEVGTLLAYMLVIKKIERLGDQTKNVFDLAAEHVLLSGAPDLPEMIEQRDEISEMISSAAEIFAERDKEHGGRFIVRGDELLDHFDALIKSRIHSDEPASQAVPRVLLHRYLKRIVANLMGVVSSVLLPLDEIDKYDESRDTRD